MLNFIDVFSGAGGLSCGLEQAGMRCVLGIDHDKHAMKTFEKNHKHAYAFCGPIQELTEKKLIELVQGQKIHAVVGGPPCQGFSTVGKGDPKDIRNKLFLEFVRLVKTTRPYFIVIENVTGLLAKKNEATLKKILKHFTDLGYELRFQVMSAHLYGVPEKRRRTIIIGSKINSQFEFPLPTHNEEVGGFVTVDEAFSDLTAPDGQIHNHETKEAQIKKTIELERIKHIPEGKGIRYESDEKAYLPKNLKLGIDWKTMNEGRFRQTKYQRLDGKLAAPTIMTHRHTYYHPREHRFLTVREAARLQSFPNDFVFTGPISAQWRQIGNAVPPLLGKAIGEKLLELFNSAKNQNTSVRTKSSNYSKAPLNDGIKAVREKAFVYSRQKPSTKQSRDAAVENNKLN